MNRTRFYVARREADGEFHTYSASAPNLAAAQRRANAIAGRAEDRTLKWKRQSGNQWTAEGDEGTTWFVISRGDGRG